MDLVRMPYRHIFCWPFHSTSLKLAGGFVHKVRFITSTDIIPARHFTSCSRFPTQPRASLCGVIFIQPRRFVSRSPGARNFYDVLEINQQASPADIKAAYYKLSKQYHPDINQAGDAVKKFREITEAYEILGNTKSRETYDTNLRGGHTTTDTSYQSGSAARQRNRYTETDFNDFEERYRQFRAQAFGRRKGAAPPTGKTEYYDYDEFYRQHYQDTRARAYNEQRWREMNEYLRYQQFSETLRTSNVRWRLLIMAMLFMSMMIVMFDATINEMLTPDDRVRIRLERERWEREHMGRMRLMREEVIQRHHGNTNNSSRVVIQEQNDDGQRNNTQETAVPNP